MTYLEKLKDPRWQKKRLEILSRDEFQCKRCGNKEKTLHVHHFCYDLSHNPWDVDDTALLTICEDCHDVEHKKGLSYKEEKLKDILIFISTCYEGKDSLVNSSIREMNSVILNTI